MGDKQGFVQVVIPSVIPRIGCFGDHKLPKPHCVFDIAILEMLDHLKDLFVKQEY